MKFDDPDVVEGLEVLVNLGKEGLSEKMHELTNKLVDEVNNGMPTAINIICLLTVAESLGQHAAKDNPSTFIPALTLLSKLRHALGNEVAEILREYRDFKTRESN